MKKVISIVGARPQFIKASPLSMELRKHFKEVIVHTGQHYDYGMSDIFFKELSIPEPDYNLGIGSGPHGAQTASMLSAIEVVLMKERPSLIIVFGDTNSTLAGALAAVKLHIPVAHIEAGMRSFNRKMPEEINRVLTDHMSKWLFVPSNVSRSNLENEGIRQNVHIVGDIMYDAIVFFREHANQKSNIIERLKLSSQSYYLSTIHRAENTDDNVRLQNIFKALSNCSKQVILPLHPRTLKRISDLGLCIDESVKIIDPVGYLDMIQLMQNADCIITDSGGMQKEAYYLSVPCVTMRDDTEWTETVDTGWNAMVGASVENIVKSASRSNLVRALPHPNLYGAGNTAKKIADILARDI